MKKRVGRPTIDNKREIEIRFRVSELENNELHSLVTHYDMNVSQLLRFLVCKELMFLTSHQNRLFASLSIADISDKDLSLISRDKSAFDARTPGRVS